MDDARTTLDRLIAQTPASRVRAVDGARALAILAVVVGHWLAAAVVAVNGDIGGVNVLGEADWTHPFTWVFQVMAVIFLAGGFASAASWASWRERGGAWGGWASQRAARLLQPTLAFVGVGAGALALGRLFGFPADLAHDAGWLVAIALWFLGVYVVTTVATPALVALFERHRWWALGAMVGVVALGDAAHLTTGEQAYAWANFIIAWLVFQYVGVAWHAGGLPTRLARLLAAGALGAAALAALGPYPLSMVNVPGGEV